MVFRPRLLGWAIGAARPVMMASMADAASLAALERHVLGRGLVVGSVVVGYASLALLEEYVGIVDRCSIVVVVSGVVFVVIVSRYIIWDRWHMIDRYMYSRD